MEVQQDDPIPKNKSKTKKSIVGKVFDYFSGKTTPSFKSANKYKNRVYKTYDKIGSTASKKEKNDEFRQSRPIIKKIVKIAGSVVKVAELVK